MIERSRSSRRRNILPQIVFLLLTFLAAAFGTFFAMRLIDDESEQSGVPEIITVEIIITATPLPPKLVTALPAGGAADAGGASLEPGGRSGDGGRPPPSTPIAWGARQVALSTPTVSIAGAPAQARNCVYQLRAQRGYALWRRLALWRGLSRAAGRQRFDDRDVPESSDRRYPHRAAGRLRLTRSPRRSGAATSRDRSAARRQPQPRPSPPQFEIVAVRRFGAISPRKASACAIWESASI